MYDAFKKEIFTLRAMRACNMHDYPRMRAVAMQADAGESHTSECASCYSSLASSTEANLRLAVAYRHTCKHCF